MTFCNADQIRILIFSFLFLASSSPALAQGNEQLSKNTDTEKMQWFQDAKLGIFIHWGIYAVDGIDESWSFYNGHVSHKEYMDQLEGFTAEKYDPEYWADLIKQSGAKYAVLTTRHHDGVALWDTQMKGGTNTVEDTPAGRDLITPFVTALRDKNLKVGLYYSLSNWSHDKYDQFKRNEKRYNLEEDTQRWEQYLEYMNGQIREIGEQFNPDLWWFDGDWEHSAEEWGAQNIRNYILEINPDAIINSRLAGYGDYSTPEQGVPVYGPDADYWELCLTINGSWGYQPSDNTHKTPYQVVRIFADMIGNGGNLLLDIAPRADGSIPEIQANVLRELGAWIKRNATGIYGTRKGIPLEYFYGPTTLSPDRKKLYLFADNLSDRPVVLKGIQNEIKSIRVVNTGNTLDFERKGAIDWADYPGIIYTVIPETERDKYLTVLEVTLDSPLELFKKYGKASETDVVTQGD